MIYFIVNEKARTGKGHAIWKEISSILVENKVKYKAFKTRYKGHATYFAKKISRLPYEHINLVVVGGDGTVNEVINGIEDFDKVRFGLIPIGSGNDFGRGLGITKDYETMLSRIIEATNAIAEDESKEKEYIDNIDLGVVSYNKVETPRYFAISSGIGMDAIVCKKALDSKLKKILNKLHIGKLTYILLTLITLFSMDTYNVTVKYDDTKIIRFRKMIFLAMMNFRAEGGGVPMAPNASARDGKISMCAAYGIPKWRTFFVLPFLVSARHQNIKGIHIQNFRKAHIEIDKPIVLHADGEYCGDVTSIDVTVMDKTLALIKNY